MFAAAIALFGAYVTIIDNLCNYSISIVEANVTLWCCSFNESLSCIFVLHICIHFESQDYYIIHTLLTNVLLVSRLRNNLLIKAKIRTIYHMQHFIACLHFTSG